MSRGQGNFSYTAVPSPSESLSGKLLHQTSDSVSETLSDMLSTGEALELYGGLEAAFLFHGAQLGRKQI